MGECTLTRPDVPEFLNVLSSTSNVWASRRLYQINGTAKNASIL